MALETYKTIRFAKHDDGMIVVFNAEAKGGPLGYIFPRLAVGKGEIVGQRLPGFDVRKNGVETQAETETEALEAFV